jgi:hypothetical protein
MLRESLASVFWSLSFCDLGIAELVIAYDNGFKVELFLGIK